MLSPLNVVLLSRKTIDDLFDDAVKRGRMTRSDAQEMAQSLVSRGARATDDFLSDLERMLGSRGDTGETDGDAGDGSTPNLPIAGYDELSAPQVQERLDGLTPAELRKLRDYEQGFSCGGGSAKNAAATIHRILPSSHCYHAEHGFAVPDRQIRTSGVRHPGLSKRVARHS